VKKSREFSGARLAPGSLSGCRRRLGRPSLRFPQYACWRPREDCHKPSARQPSCQCCCSGSNPAAVSRIPFAPVLLIPHKHITIAEPENDRGITGNPSSLIHSRESERRLPTELPSADQLANDTVTLSILYPHLHLHLQILNPLVKLLAISSPAPPNP
jgi:hypothetical protein